MSSLWASVLSLFEQKTHINKDDDHIDNFQNVINLIEALPKKQKNEWTHYGISRDLCLTKKNAKYQSFVDTKGRMYPALHKRIYMNGDEYIITEYYKDNFCVEAHTTPYVKMKSAS